VWREEKGSDRYRRATYTFRYRSVPYPALQNFDAPNGDFSCVRRSRSNTPLQALTTLNEPLFVECAKNLAQVTLREGGQSDGERLAYAFRRCVSRAPSSDELTVLAKLLSDERSRHIQNNTNPADRDLATWTVAARVLLNLDETITKE
jgi:hypothetical protein